jgi:DnaJ-class molecular chaperone
MVIVNVDIPAHLNGEQRRLFEELARTLGQEPHPQEHGFLDKLKEVLGG